MKCSFLFLVLFTSHSLSAKIKQEKVEEAFAKARFQQTKDTLFFVLSEDKTLEDEKAKKNQPPSSKIFGPYRLHLKGIKPGTRFGLYDCNLLGIDNPPFFCAGYIDENGEAFVKQEQRDIKLTGLVRYFGGTLPGEPMYSLIVLDDRETYIATRIIPVPLEAYGEKGRHVTMEILTANAPLYLIQGENFQPEEEVSFLIHSRGEEGIKKIKASQQGSFSMFLEGEVSQRNQLEKDYIKVTTAEQTKPMTIAYSWRFLEAKK